MSKWQKIIYISFDRRGEKDGRCGGTKFERRWDVGFFRKGEWKNLKFYRCKLKSGNKVGSDTCVGTYFLYTFGGGGGYTRCRLEERAREEGKERGVKRGCEGKAGKYTGKLGIKI